ncbi:PDZ domain-containing protein 8 [Geodia barretti]|nr:PDZ domain-containing protein 8 [Geodia barretti]
MRTFDPKMLAALVLAFVLGGLFSLLLAASAWLYTTAVGKREKAWAISPFKLPQFPSDVMGVGGEEESCRWFNLVTSFLFQELRDTAEVKGLILRKVNKEFNELMFTKKEGRMLEQLTVRDYDLGTSLPTFSNVVVLKKKLNNDTDELEDLCLGVNVEYSGGCRIGIDADLIFNRVAYVAIHVVKVKGCGQLQFATEPHTHWSFSFCEDPELDIVVESTFEGRSFPQLSLFMEGQLRRWVRQKHTLPAHKTRYKPFFSKPKPQSQLDELYVHNQKLTVGRLYVEIVKVSRLLHSPSAVATFCTLNTSSLPWQPLLGVWRSRWAEHEFRFRLHDSLGIRYRLVVWDGKEERGSEFVVIFEVVGGSLAASSGVREGDIIVRVNNVKVHSVTQVQKTINKTKHGSILLTVKRPPKHISSHMLQSGNAHRATPTSQRTPSGVSSDVEGEESVTREDGDSISLRGVGGERGLSSGQRTTAHSLDAKAEVLPRDTRNVDEEEAVVRQTDEVPRGSHWSRNKFCLNVLPHHRYLNLCVYDRLGTSEGRRELLVGHVTVPLMDVALECLVSSSGRHHQKYVLLAPQPYRATSSRAAIQASEGRRGERGRGKGREEKKQEEDKKFVGSLLLRFRYSTLQHKFRNEEDEEEGDDGVETCDSPVEEEEEEEEEAVELQHQFNAKEMEGTQKCNICTKRIWALKGRVMVCTQCGVQCHKKCLPLAHQRLPCW